MENIIFDLPDSQGLNSNNLNSNEAYEILNRDVPGYHRHILTCPAVLCFASENLCEMTGYSADELLFENEDGYLSVVHPDDAEIYLAFLDRLRQCECEDFEIYRIVKKDGGIIRVRDASRSQKNAEGLLVSSSVLKDITEETKIKDENAALRRLGETLSCGIARFTCENRPRITYMNEQMLKILRFPESADAEPFPDDGRENIYLLIPIEDRRKFALYMNRIYTSGTPVAGEMSVLRCDGTRAHLFGWVTKSVGEDGKEEFQSVCLDITEQHRTKKEEETKRYLKAMSGLYDKIFEFDLSVGTVTCLYSSNSPLFRRLENIPMQMKDATEKWIDGMVTAEDRERVREFFSSFYSVNSVNSSDSLSERKSERRDYGPPRIKFRATSSDGSVKTYTGLILSIDSSIYLFCCKTVLKGEDADYLRYENRSLKENMQNIVSRFTDGIAAFEVNMGRVKPLYASENVCAFFGFTKDEWLSLMEKPAPIKEFVSRSSVDYADFEKLLSNGEETFSYYDIDSRTKKYIKAVCSAPSSGDGDALPRYVMLYNTAVAGDGAETDKGGGERAVTVRTFGYFDVFVGATPIAFRNKKSKELFALLVDRRGGYVSSDEAISFLWENESVNPVTLARYRKVALRLKNILEEYGISDVIESVDGKRRIVPDKVRCDLFDYLSGKEEYSKLFKGSYLTNYSWGENTLAELMGNITK